MQISGSVLVLVAEKLTPFALAIKEAHMWHLPYAKVSIQENHKTEQLDSDTTTLGYKEMEVYAAMRLVSLKYLSSMRDNL